MKLIFLIFGIWMLIACDKVEEGKKMDELNFERQEEYDESDFRDNTILPSKDPAWSNGEVDD